MDAAWSQGPRIVTFPALGAGPSERDAVELDPLTLLPLDLTLSLDPLLLIPPSSPPCRWLCLAAPAKGFGEWRSSILRVLVRGRDVCSTGGRGWNVG